MTSIPWSQSSGFGRRRPRPRAGAPAERLTQPFLELSRLLRDPVYWGVGVPRGDRHPVLVLPGLFAGDRSLAPLRRWLRRVGYTPVRSGLDRNPGWSEELAAELEELVERVARERGCPLTIIGHSFGGVLAHAVARRRPADVRHVIALGSPLRLARAPLPDAVRHTALLSAEDRVVRPDAARAREPHARTIEVRGSHSGLVVNAAVYRELARLLPAADDRVNLL
jgi:pimeloyl-ACP methyl ester carboxylesterase